jgi:hypothetical protein
MATPSIKNLNDSSPAAATGYANAKWQQGSSSGDDPTSGYPIFPASVETPNAGGVAKLTANATAAAADCGKLLSFTLSGTATYTLPATAPSVPDGGGTNRWKVALRNDASSSAALTVAATSPAKLDGTAGGSFTLAAGAGCDVFTDGTDYFSEKGAAAAPTIVSTVGITIDGGGSTPATGTKGFIQVPFAGTLIGWSLVADVSGSASVDIWKVASSAPPSAPSVPTSTNKISATAPCALSSAQSAAVGSSGVSTWTTTVAAWDVFGFNLTAATTVTRLTLEIQIQRS